MAKVNPSGTVTLVTGVGHGTSKGNGTGNPKRSAPLAITGGGTGTLKVIPKRDKPV
ncbi:gp013 [Rhodococcus phage ReqiDocB7]|uniref:gp013 n=1 Tax=Rhodococcus phage ReqiDocB7 TaxID=691966 RepID=UPI0001CDD74F|nr:gp013 [Rhodococcus phage ReqiDocB7]ADD80799.1 gp013 [Rhodococcus phage ReqiDocB7]